MKRRIRRLRINRNLTMGKKLNLLKFIKEHPNLIFTIFSVAISAFIAIFMLLTYESPPSVKCSVDLIQRPDSVYQFQLYVWNEGDQIARDIVIWAKSKDIFQWDTSSNKNKSPLYVYPYFSVNIQITPNEILDYLARKRPFEDHQIIIPQLPSTNRNDNYLIVCPHLIKINHYTNLPQSIFSEKFITLKKINGVKSFSEEFLENVKVFYAGSPIKFEIVNIINLEEVGEKQFYFPSYEELINYRKNAIIPYNTIMPNKEKIIKNKRDKEDDDWFFQLNK